MIFGLVSFIAGAPIDNGKDIVRFDRVGGAFSDEFETIELKAYPKIETNMKVLAPNEAWQVTMVCPGIDKELCDKAKIGLEDAGRLIAESLQVSKIITMKATFRSFGQQQKNVLGRATYGSSFVVKKQTGYYTMGQALLKQHMTDIAVPMSDTDIVAEFNADYNWYFKDSGMTVEGKQDFTYVALHDIPHGLGFGSAMLRKSNKLNQTYLAPEIKQNGQAQYYKPIDIYDAFIANGDQSITFRSMNEELSSLPQDSRPTAFAQNNAQLKLGQDLMSIATKGPQTLFFHTTDGKRIELFSPQQFQPGSSLHHVATMNSNTEDWMMVPALRGGVTVDDLMNNSNSTKVYGPGIRSIMTSIGWPTIDDPTIQIIQVALRYGSGSSSFDNIALTFTFAIILHFL